MAGYASARYAESLREWPVPRRRERGGGWILVRQMADQLSVAGTAMFAARETGGTVGMVLWYVCGDVAYYHLGAYRDRGYELGASFGIFQVALERFRQSGLRLLCLGAGAGLAADADDGLTRFKRGWATATRAAYPCGRVFDHAGCAQACAGVSADASYFPACCAGEFGGAGSGGTTG